MKIKMKNKWNKIIIGVKNMKIKMKNKWNRRYIKLMLYLNFNYWKIPEKKYFRLNKKLSKLRSLSDKETMKNLGIKEK